ncbi:hypothetical protein JCM19045_3400 [Bacillus sp. JCM 19045]|nr:hypothetical protein JCM19045_3400 [Bacillus sp. JCM 19045]
MKQVKSLIQVMLPDLFKSFTTFWFILLAILIAGYIITSIFAATDVFLTTWPFFVIWLSITIFQIVKTDFHYALKMGATRKQFAFASISILLLLIVLGEGVQLIYINALPIVADTIGLQAVNLFTWAELFPELSAGMVIAYDLIIAFFFGTVLFTIACIKFHFGKLPMFILLGAIGIVMLIPTINQAVLNHIISLHYGENLLTVFFLLIPAVIGLLVSQQTLLKASLR